jgi:hypothetical protein
VTSRDRSPSALVRYFAGLAEQTFETRLGVADTPLIDYIADLLVRFVRMDALYRMRNPRGGRLTGVAEMRIEAEQRVGAARREAHRQIGDFVLFWTGVYPEALPRLRHETRLDHLLDYQTEGRRAYQIASTIPAAEEDPDGDILARLAHQFDLCAFGLGEVRREWERRDDGVVPLIVLK